MENQETSSKKGSRVERWGNHAEIFDEGYLAVPIKFLTHYAGEEMGHLSNNEAMLVLHLMSFKWGRDAPFPTYKTLARRMGVSEKMVRRYAQSLQKKKLLVRLFRTREANRFDLSGLFDVLRRIQKGSSKNRHSTVFRSQNDDAQVQV